MIKKQQILVIVGPTASGKSALGVKLAEQKNGEVVSADSRQVYKGMDIGSGKITKREMKGVPHHLLDVADPKKPFSVAQYQKLAHQAIANILKRGKLPIIVGGTGFYIQSIVDNIILPAVPPNQKLRKKLAKLSIIELFAALKKLDPARAKTVDTKNPPRLIRAIEIAIKLGHVPNLEAKLPSWEIGMIGINPPPEILKQKIHKRLLSRLKSGMVNEVKKLHAGGTSRAKSRGLSWKKLEAFGLEYRYVAQFLQNKITKLEMIAKIETESYRYTKRQMTWFKRDKRIKWII